jgi:hypothetical protein
MNVEPDIVFTKNAGIWLVRSVSFLARIRFVSYNFLAFREVPGQPIPVPLASLSGQPPSNFLWLHYIGR